MYFKCIINLIWFVVIFSPIFFTGCLSTGSKTEVPKYEQNATTLIVLQSNQENTDFFVNGEKVGRGKRFEIRINPSKEYTLSAKPDGYKVKEDTIIPPYSDGYLVEFVFMIGDREKLPTGVAVKSATEEKPAAMSTTKSKDVKLNGELPSQKDKQIVTVLDFSMENIEKSEGMLLIDLLSSALVDISVFRVLDRSQRQKLLEEVKFTNTGLTDDAAQLEIGRLLASDKIVLGSVGKVGAKYLFNAKLVDVETGESLATAFNTYSTMESLVDDLYTIAKNLCASFLQK